MTKPWESDNCEQLRAHFAYYAVPVAAMLWCGVPPEDIEQELRRTEPHPNIRGALRHPYIPCLEPRCRVLHDAIDRGALPCSRENGKALAPNDHVAPERRHVSRNDLKEWVAREFPADKPTFLFDEIERATHPAISADAYRALVAERDTHKRRAENLAEDVRKLIAERNTVESECDALRAIVEKMSAPGGRAETTYLNIVGGLLGLLLGKSPAGNAQSVFSSQAAIISAMLAHYGGKPGVSDTTLEAKFAEAKRSLQSS